MWLYLLLCIILTIWLYKLTFFFFLTLTKVYLWQVGRAGSNAEIVSSWDFKAGTGWAALLPVSVPVPLLFPSLAVPHIGWYPSLHVSAPLISPANSHPCSYPQAKGFSSLQCGLTWGRWSWKGCPWRSWWWGRWHSLWAGMSPWPSVWTLCPFRKAMTWEGQRVRLVWLRVGVPIAAVWEIPAKAIVIASLGVQLGVTPKPVLFLLMNTELLLPALVSD